MDNAPDTRSRARLLAVTTKESSAWLNVLFISSLGLRMDDESIRVAVGLRLGTPLCQPHSCNLCGAEVDHLATHGLSCHRSTGRHPRHSALNDIIHRALAAAKIPSRLEPSGLYRSDGKRPDGASLVPWRRAKFLVWDATCKDTFAPSYVSYAAREAGLVAKLAEERKRSKYRHLAASHIFVPVVVEIPGVFGMEALEFIKELGHRLNSPQERLSLGCTSSRGCQSQSSEGIQQQCWGHSGAPCMRPSIALDSFGCGNCSTLQ